MGNLNERNKSSSKYAFTDYPWIFGIHRRDDPNVGVQT